MRIANSITIAILCWLTFGGNKCQDGTPGTPNGELPSVTVTELKHIVLDFNFPGNDRKPQRSDPCIWFDGSQNKANIVEVEIREFHGEDQPTGRRVGEVQEYLDEHITEINPPHGFASGDPQGMSIHVPSDGKDYWIIVRVWGRCAVCCSSDFAMVCEAKRKYCHRCGESLFYVLPKAVGCQDCILISRRL